MSVDSKYDVLHKMINASIFGWPDGEVEKAHALLEEIRDYHRITENTLTAEMVTQLDFEEFRVKMISDALGEKVKTLGDVVDLINKLKANQK